MLSLTFYKLPESCTFFCFASTCLGLALAAGGGLTGSDCLLCALDLKGSCSLKLCFLLATCDSSFVYALCCSNVVCLSSLSDAVMVSVVWNPLCCFLIGERASFRTFDFFYWRLARGITYCDFMGGGLAGFCSQRYLSKTILGCGYFLDASLCFAL
jgi:hypothetical protein